MIKVPFAPARTTMDHTAEKHIGELKAERDAANERAELAAEVIAELEGRIALAEWWEGIGKQENVNLISRLASLQAALDGNRPLPIDRDTLGRMVREAWVRWAQKQPSPKPSWLAPYDELSEPDKEADRQIGEAVARWTLIHDAAALAASELKERDDANQDR